MRVITYTCTVIKLSLIKHFRVTLLYFNIPGDVLSPASDAITAKHEEVLLKKLLKARDNWYYIGKGIGVTDADLKEIDNRYLPDKVRCLDEVLKRRIQQGGLSRSMLCECLRGEFVGRDDVATEIEALDLNPAN